MHIYNYRVIVSEEESNTVDTDYFEVEDEEIDDYYITNTYEPFLNYVRYHNFPGRISTNGPFFKDFKDSLFTLDFDYYNIDDYFGFLTVENINRPGYYFYFLVSSKMICITEYTNKRTIKENGKVIK